MHYQISIINNLLQVLLYILHSIIINSPQKRIRIDKMEDNTYSIGQTYQQQSNFPIFNRTIAHQNQLRIERAQNPTQQLIVRNQFAIERENQITKKTQIWLGDKTIIITDKFSLSDTGMNSVNQMVIIENVQAQNKRNKQRSKNNGGSTDDVQVKVEEKYKKNNDFRNVVKNIVKHFLNWAQFSDNANVRLRSVLGKIIHKNIRYNNKLIMNIVKNHQIRDSFLQFCESSALQCIKQSKIQNKQIHYEALKKYRELCIEEYNKSNRKSEDKNIQVLQEQQKKVRERWVRIDSDMSADMLDMNPLQHDD